MSTSVQRVQNYTAEQVDRGLLELAICGGNSAEASRRLKACGTVIPDRTLRDWRTTMAARYTEISNNHARQVEDVIVQECRENAVRLADLERKTADRLEEELPNLKATRRLLRSGTSRPRRRSTSTRCSSSPVGPLRCASSGLGRRSSRRWPRAYRRLRR